MFDKPFEQLFAALERIEKQLLDAGDKEKEILREELTALRSVCDRFVEKWLAFEEKLADLSDRFGLNIDFAPPSKQDKHDPIPKPAKQVQTFVVPQIPLLPEAEEEPVVRLFRRGLGYFDLLMFSHAIRELERVVELDGEFTVARLYLAYGYLGRKEYEKAERQLNLVAVGAGDPFILAAVHNTFGHIYAAGGDYERAAEEFKQTAEYMPHFRDVFYNLGVCQHNLKRYRDALASFLVALDEEPDDWEAEKICAGLWLKAGSQDKAHHHIRKAYGLNSSDYGILMMYADLSLRRGEFDLARSLYARAERFYPEAVRPIGGIGWLAMQQGDYRTAVARFKKQLSLAPQDLQAQFNLGWAFLMEGNAGKAEAVFRSLMEKKPGWAEARIGMARVMQMRNRPEEAYRMLEPVIQSRDRRVRKLGHLQAGRLKLEQGSYQTALDQFAEALKIDDSCTETWFYKGLAHSGLGELDLAEQCWIRCRQVLPAGAKD